MLKSENHIYHSPAHSVVIAAKHYLQVTDEHFERATQAVEAVQNPVQYTAERTRTVTNQESKNPHSRYRERGFSAACEMGAKPEMGDIGLEPTTSRV